MWVVIVVIAAVRCCFDFLFFPSFGPPVIVPFFSVLRCFLHLVLLNNLAD